MTKFEKFGRELIVAYLIPAAFDISGCLILNFSSIQIYVRSNSNFRSFALHSNNLMCAVDKIIHFDTVVLVLLFKFAADWRKAVGNWVEKRKDFTSEIALTLLLTSSIVLHWLFQFVLIHFI